MRKQLLLAAALGALAIRPAPASAHDPAPPNVVSSLGVRIIVRDGPKVVHHHHRPGGGHLRPQPWVRHFSRPPIVRWQQPWHRQMQHFPFRHGDYGAWFRGRHVGPAAPGRWGHAPGHHDRPAFRRDAPHDGFMRGHPRSDRHRRR
jgi:hypothetical protein